MTSDSDQPDFDFIDRKEYADPAQYVPYATPAPVRPCYYCGAQTIEGSAFCQRCCDWINDRAQKKARLSFRLGLAAILILAAGIVIFLSIIFVFDLDRNVEATVIQISIYMLPASLALGAISISSARESKKLAGFLQFSSVNEQAGLLRTSSAGESMGTISMALVGALILFAILAVIAFILGLLTMAQ
jgi:predicted nucleic acid-binding Zn ribbon protein